MEHLKLDFGQYCEVFESTSNDMKSRSVRAIALRPRNTMGSYFFMFQRTGRMIHAEQWIELHVNYNVVQRVHELADTDGIPDMVGGQYLFEWEPGIPILDGYPDRHEELTDTGERAYNDEQEVVVFDMNDNADQNMGRINQNKDIDSDKDMEDTTESDQCTSDDSK